MIAFAPALLFRTCCLYTTTARHASHGFEGVFGGDPQATCAAFYDGGDLYDWEVLYEEDRKSYAHTQTHDMFQRAVHMGQERAFAIVVSWARDLNPTHEHRMIPIFLLTCPFSYDQIVTRDTATFGNIHCGPGLWSARLSLLLTLVTTSHRFSFITYFALHFSGRGTQSRIARESNTD